MSRYDEDLYDNPFFIQLEKQQKALFEKASSNRWIICIPKYVKTKDATTTKVDFEDHILVPITGSDDTFTTVSKHSVAIENGQVVLASGFKAQKNVEILFEETFYNSKDESYRVLCVTEFFNRETIQDISVTGEADFSRPPATYEECYRVLWGHQGSIKTKESIDRLLLTFCTEYQRFTGDIVPTLVDLVSSHVTKAMQLVLKDQNVKRNIKQNDMSLASLKLSVEMYMMNAVHKHLFSVITNLVKHTDANVNKLNRNLTDLRLHHLDVRSEYEENLPGARRELSMLNKYSTPLGRLMCLKRVVTALTRPIKAKLNDESLLITTDDLLPLLIYLILKSPIPNWTANLMYMKHFLLCKISETDEFSFYLATTEAALDYIGSGNLKSSKTLGHTSETLYTRQGSTGSLTSAKEKFFQYVQYGDESAVSLMLKRPKCNQDEILAQLCHPLCTCEKCIEISARSVQNSGVVSPIVRDDMGRTALHLAAFYGQAGLIDVLVKNGCLTDGTDYLGNTPLHMASQKGHQNIILLLVHFGADVSATDSEGNTPLHMCAKNGHEDCVKAILFLDILKNRLNVTAKNDMGDTPLHLAAKWGYDGIVSFLLESEADPRVRNRKRQTPFDVAQNPDIKKALQQILDDPPPMIIRHPIPQKSIPDPECHKPSPASSNQTPAHPTSSTQDTPTSEAPKTPLGFEVVDVKPRPHIPMIDNTSSAMMSPTTPVVVSLDQTNLRQIERLFKAIANKDYPLVNYYLGWMDNPEDSPTSPSPLLSPTATAADQLCHPLCMCDKCQNIQKMINDQSPPVNQILTRPIRLPLNLELTKHSNVNCLHINCQNKKGFAPLHISVIENNMEVFNTLMTRGAYVNIQTVKHITPLHLACFHNQLRMVDRLIDCGANVNIHDQHGEIPLHLACAKSSPQIINILIKHSSSVNVGNVDGQTPLHHAVARGSVDVVQILLSHGANPTLINKNNKSPLDTAKDPEIQNILKDKLYVIEKSQLFVPKSVSAPENLKPVPYSPSETGSLDTAAGSQEDPSGSSKDVDKLRHLASDLDNNDVNSLQQLGLSIKSFDKDKSLKRSKTFDHSAPSIDNRDLKLSLSIKHFDKSKTLKKSSTLDHSSPVLDSRDLKLALSIKGFDKEHSLRRTKTLDRSRANLEPLRLPLSIQHFETGTLKHVEPVDRSSPLHIYSLTRSFSCYSDYTDTPVVEENKALAEAIEDITGNVENVDTKEGEVNCDIDGDEGLEKVPGAIGVQLENRDKDTGTTDSNVEHKQCDQVIREKSECTNRLEEVVLDDGHGGISNDPGGENIHAQITGVEVNSHQEQCELEDKLHAENPAKVSDIIQNGSETVDQSGNNGLFVDSHGTSNSSVPIIVNHNTVDTDNTCTTVATGNEKTCTNTTLVTGNDETCTDTTVTVVTGNDETCTDTTVVTGNDETCTDTTVATDNDETCTDTALVTGNDELFTTVVTGNNEIFTALVTSNDELLTADVTETDSGLNGETCDLQVENSRKLSDIDNGEVT